MNLTVLLTALADLAVPAFVAAAPVDGDARAVPAVRVTRGTPVRPRHHYLAVFALVAGRAAAHVDSLAAAAVQARDHALG